MALSTIDLNTVEMTLDIMQYVLARISEREPELGAPRSYEDLKQEIGETITEKGIGGQNAFEIFKNVLLKATVAEDHPRNLAFVPAAPSKASVLFDLVTAASSIHGAYWMLGAGGIFCEMEAMKWLVTALGMPESASGVFTSGGTAANLSALLAAREKWIEQSSENKDIKSLIVASAGAHSSVKQMARVMGADILYVEDDEQDRLSGENLQNFIQDLDPKDRGRVFAIVATSGTTNGGIIDDLDGIAEVCEQENLWMHVDGAYGGAAVIAPSVRPLFKGIERADSITIDPHKWLFAPYDCGAVLYKDMDQAKKAHTQKGTYLEIFKDKGAQGFNPADYQIQLTRRTRGMPLWFSLAMNGTQIYEYSIEKALSMAIKSAELIQEAEHLKLVREPSLSVVLFTRKGWEMEDYKKWTYENHQKGFALVTPTIWIKNGVEYPVARFCFINPDTELEDVQKILESMK